MTNLSTLFGESYSYNPIPKVRRWAILGYPDAGKSSFTVQMLSRHEGQAGLVVDADQRWEDVTVPNGSPFFPVCDKPHENLDCVKIDQSLRTKMPQVHDQVGLIVVDSLTAIFEPLVLQAQMTEGQNRAAIMRIKADAMKLLNNSVSMWGTDTALIYHYRDRLDGKGKMGRTTSISALELARLGRNITMTLAIFKDSDGRYGVHVLNARRGRKGITLYDETGGWIGMPERIEEAVYAGLTKEEQDQIEEDELHFDSPEDAINWAYAVGEPHEIWGDRKHTVNSYEKLKRDMAETEPNLTAEVFYAAWVEKVQGKISEAESD